MAINTAEKFFAVLEKSKLLSPEQLADARRATREGDDPKMIAKALARKELITWWQAGQLLAGRSSFFLGKYKLIELLGRGGMGSVFLGQHITMNRRVALKILSRRVAKDPASLERFLSEARAIAALDHPNIVRAYSVDNHHDRYYIVMEYVDGRDLQRLVEADGPMDYQTAADFICQAADGLAHGHDHGMIHCDIKPSNLLVNSQGVVKIVDMGLTRLTGDVTQSDEQDSRILGTVDYQAPEQALESSDFDHRADIYSLGCTLYFLLTGHPPFPDGTLSERIMKHQRQQPRSITEQRPDAPASLVKVCQKMMAKKVEDRYQSAQELSQVLAAWRPPPPKRGAALKVADKLDERPDEGLPMIDTGAGSRRKPTGKGLPSINVDPATKPSKPADAVGARDKPAEKVGLLQTLQRKIIAAVLVLLAIMVLAAGVTIPLLVFSGSGNGDKEQARADAAERATDRERPHAKRSTPDEDSVEEEDLEGPEELPVEQPEPDQPGPEQPEPGKKPEPEPEAKPEPKAEPKPEPERKPEAKPKPEPKPEPERKPEEKPEPAPKPDQVDPFKKLAKAVALPPVKAAASGGKATVPVTLGELQLKPGASVTVELCGGENAVRGNRKFDLKPGEIGKSWLVRFEEESKTGGAPRRTDVARVLLDGQTLKFQWLEGAGKVRSGGLRNCGLNVMVDGKVRWLPLAQPQHVEPLKLNLDRSSAKTSLATKWLPEANTLRLQITRLEGEFPAPKFDPGHTIEAKGKTNIVLAGKDMLKVTLPVSFAAKTRSVAIEVSATYQMKGIPAQPLKPRAVRPIIAGALGAHHRLNATVAGLKGENMKKAAQTQLDAIGTAIDQLNALLIFCEKVHNKGKIHFRVFAIPDGNDEHQIELFTTEPPPGEVLDDDESDNELDDDLDLGDPDAEEKDEGLNLDGKKKKFF